ncbi:MAG TPA: GTP 3',8-cyclase MoaA [Candidatus Limiplasma sp.]|nr:GTP 3',8-cyclase MoaA [Candidatus Limiplasma sp.]HPS82303.1 GTP 3',8-cyclase MoaA [Candidatus Limiplasma sp.]
MLDTHGREVRALRLAVTEACDMRCRYCMPENGIAPRGEALSADELVAIARAAARCGINKIRITGGEPLIRPDIIEICERIGRLQGIEELCLTTNGTRLARLAQPLRQAGVRRVNLSLDSLRPDRYQSITRGGNLSDVLSGLDAALQAGFDRVKLNCVLMGDLNEDEIADFVALTRAMPVDVRFIELMPMGECARWPQSAFVNASEVLRRCPELVPLDREGVAQRYRLPDGQGAVGLISPMSHAFCGDCDRIRVTADGMLKPCLHSGLELNLRGLDDAALLAIVAEGIGDKPATHSLNETGTGTTRRMNQIGG